MRRPALSVVLFALVTCGCSVAAPELTVTSVPTSTPEPTATTTSTPTATPEPTATLEPTDQPAKVLTDLAPFPERSFVLEVQKYNALGYTFVIAESEGGPSTAIDFSTHLSVGVVYFIWGDPVEQFTISRTLDMPERPQLDLIEEFLRNISVSDECIRGLAQELLPRPLVAWITESWECDQYEFIRSLTSSNSSVEAVDLIVFPP